MLFLYGAGLLCLSGLSAAVNPSISFISGPELIHDVGSKAELECRVEHGKEYPINWIKIRDDRGKNQEVMPLSTGKTLAIRDARFKIVYDSAVSSYTLQINDIQDIDAATYQCQVIVGINNKISKEVSLKVRMPPAFLEAETSAPVVGVEGEKLELKCPVSGFPAPRIEWRRRDGKVMPGTSELLIIGEKLQVDNVRRNDEAVYICSADNKVGDPIEKSFNVEVRFPPHIRVPRPRIHQALGYGVSITCEIAAYPIPAIVWSKDGVTITNDNVFSVLHFAKNSRTIATSVKISEMESSLYGTYECKATNVHGSVVEKLELIKTEMPIPEAVYSSADPSSLSGYFIRISLIAPILFSVLLF